MCCSKALLSSARHHLLHWYKHDIWLLYAVYDEEMLVVQLQNELAKLEVDILHTQSHNLRLEQALKLLDQDINEKMQTIGKYEVSSCI